MDFKKLFYAKLVSMLSQSFPSLVKSFDLVSIINVCIKHYLETDDLSFSFSVDSVKFPNLVCCLLLGIHYSLIDHSDDICCRFSLFSGYKIEGSTITLTLSALSTYNQEFGLFARGLSDKLKLQRIEATFEHEGRELHHYSSLESSIVVDKECC